MKRLASEPRPDWREKFDALGFSFHSADGGYWDESACYQFSVAEIDVLEEASRTVHEMCLRAVEHVITRGRCGELDIPASFVPLIERSWKAREPSLYGRFDFSFDGAHPPRLLEYNADTPTSVLEAAVAQWHWLEETGRPDQFNSLHDKLIDRWKVIAGSLPIAATVHFSSVRDNAEDFATVEYLRDVAIQAGIATHFCHVEDIGWNGKQFVDDDGVPVRAWFKLYPWEWLMREEFGAHLGGAGMRVIEPPWKSILSNKGILPILWELYPHHPNLLPAYWDASLLGPRHAKKPLHSREGANVTLADGTRNMRSEGPYTGRAIYQALEPLPEFAGKFPVIGCWIVGDEPAGMGIREDNSPITTNASRFVPHFFA
jgi:glutathionylspermidine synthase